MAEAVSDSVSTSGVRAMAEAVSDSVSISGVGAMVEGVSDSVSTFGVGAPRQRGQQFTLTLARPKAISKISYQRLKGVGLKPIFLLFLPSRKTRLLFWKQTPRRGIEVRWN